MQKPPLLFNPITRILLLLALLIPFPLHAAESSCRQSADTWILHLDDAKHTELFQRYTQNDCSFAGKYIKQSVEDNNQAHRERMSNDAGWFP